MIFFFFFLATDWGWWFDRGMAIVNRRGRGKGRAKTRPHHLGLFLEQEINDALNRAVAAEFSSRSQVGRKALARYLIEAGFLDEQRVAAVTGEPARVPEQGGGR